jgi:hypothetical protein
MIVSIISCDEQVKVIELLVCYNSKIILGVVVNVSMKGLYA